MYKGEDYSVHTTPNVKVEHDSYSLLPSAQMYDFRALLTLLLVFCHCILLLCGRTLQYTLRVKFIGYHHNF